MGQFGTKIREKLYMILDDLSIQYKNHPYLNQNPCFPNFILPGPGFCAEKMTSFRALILRIDLQCPLV